MSGGHDDALPDEGRVMSGWPEGQRCASDTCREPLTREKGVYMHTDRETRKYVLLCSDCSIAAQIHAPLRLPLVAL